MAERASRSKRIIAKALACRRLHFDNENSSDISTNSVQVPTVETIKLPTCISAPKTQINITPCATQPKICILSDIMISGPNIPTSILDTNNYEDITPTCTEDSNAGLASERHTKPLSPIIIIKNDGSLDTQKSYDTLQNVEIIELLPQNEDHLENNTLNNDTDGSMDTQKSYETLQNVEIVELLPQNEDYLENNTLINNDTDGSLDRQKSYDILQNDEIVELLPQNEEQLENNTKIKATDSNTAETKQKKRKCNITSYMDFMSEDKDFEWSSSSWDGEDESSSSDEARENTRKRKKTTKDGKVGDLGLKKKKKTNNRKDRSLKRNSGQAYSMKDGKEVVPKTLRENPCKPEKKCPHNCYEIPEERRHQIFSYYYSLSSQRKRDWLVANSQICDVKRQRVKNKVSRRQSTYTYYINEGEGRRQVCQKFILHTLDLSQRFVHYTISNAESHLSKTDLRGKHIPTNKTSTLIKQGIVEYIKNLPAVPSHYCRKDSTRLYLPQEFKNIAHLYQLYKTDYSSKGKDYVGEKVFKNIFTTEFNIAFHIPKKDKCKKCVSFANNPTNDTEEEKKAHLKEAEESKARFKFHQQITKYDTHSLCVSFDLQKVLNTPYGESMMFYYSRKYSVYNLTFYESITREAYCYSWGECDGKRGGNEVASILLKYIQIIDARQTIKNLILYSDSCSGQNKNKIVFAAVHTALLDCQNIKTIQMNFLLPGHTSMPVDSVHAVIENSIKHTVIYAPSQWSTIFTLARKNPKPYNVEIMSYPDFMAWDSISDKYFKNNLAGKISQIRVITFKKSDPSYVYMKKSMRKDEITEKILVIRKNEQPTESLYKKKLPISDAKYRDLKSLCNSSAIPRHFHDEYLKMPHGNLKDSLPVTDFEDSD